MRKTIKHIRLEKVFLNVMLLGGLCACAGGRDDVDTKIREEIQFEVSMSGVDTRTNVGGTAFVENDTFKLFFNEDKPTLVLQSDGSERVFEFKSSKWESTSTPLYWDDQDVRLRDFCAISPYESYDAANQYFPVVKDQSTLADYLKSDLLVARIKTNKRLVPIPFWHVYSRIRVVVTASTKENDTKGWFTVDEFKKLSVELNDTYMVGVLDYSTAATDAITNVTAEAIESGADMLKDDVKMYPLSSTPTVDATAQTITMSFVAIVPPRAVINSGDLMVTASIEGGKKYYYKASETINTFAVQGKETEINLRLIKQDVIPGTIETSSIKIQGWKEIKGTDDDPITLKDE